MEDSAAALSSLTLTTALAIAQGGTGATTDGGARTALGLGDIAVENAASFATAAQGTKADAAMPKSGGAFTGAVTTNSTIDGVDIATRDGILSGTTVTANAALPKTGGTMSGDIVFNSTQAKGNSGLVPAAAANTHFLRGDGTFQDISSLGVTLTEDQVDDFAAEMFTSATHTGITSTYDDTAGTVTLAVPGTYLNSNVTPATLGLTIGTNTQAFDAKLTGLAGATNGANQIIYTTNAAGSTYGRSTVSTAGRTLIGKSTTALMRSNLNVDVAGTDNSTNVGFHTSVSDIFTLTGQTIYSATPAADAMHLWDQSANKMIMATKAEVNAFIGATAAAAGAVSTALAGTSTGNHTGTLNGVAAATVTDGAALGATANQDSTSTIQAGTTAANVGLGSVNNTTDANKPVSTAGQTALNLKADLAGPSLTGTTNAVNVTTSGNVIVGGNLTVSGTTTTVNTETIDLADNFINLNSNETGTPSEDAGISVSRGTTTDANLFWDETVDRWSLSLANLGGSGTASTPDAYISAVYTSTSAPSGNPSYGGTSGHGNMHVKTDTGDVYIYA